MSYHSVYKEISGMEWVKVKFRDGSRTAATSKMEHFVIIASG